MVKIEEGFGWDRIKDEKIREAVRALLELAEASEECVIIHLMGKSTDYTPMTMIYADPDLGEYVAEAFSKAVDFWLHGEPESEESHK